MWRQPIGGLQRTYASNYPTRVNFKQKGEIWWQILKYHFSVF